MDSLGPVYWTLNRTARGWWVKSRCPSGALSRLGPFLDKDQADIEATHQAIDWCITNGINP